MSENGEWTGRTVGGYEIESVIGQGGMATVYRAFQKQLERWVAIKVLKQHEPGDGSFLRSFRREARAIASLRHPNILTVYDYGEEEGRPYIVMEHVPGGTLETLVGEQPQPWGDVAMLIIPVARALAYAHSKGIIHCDVKPSNVLLSRPDWPLLADFGLLRLRDQQTSKPGSLSGTPTYASPEQILGKQLSGTSDMYSLGLVLYQLVTGHLPYGEISSTSLMLQRLLEHPVPPSEHVPAINEDLERIILRTLARQPGDRYQDMEALVSDLERLPGSDDVDPSSKEPELLGQPSGTQALSETPLAQGPHLAITGTGTILSLPAQEEVVLGRTTYDGDDPPDVDLGPHGALQAGVSRRHARLHYAVEGWFLEDLGSTNGTFLNSMRLKRGRVYRVHSGDVIHCARLMLVFFDQ